MSSKQLIAIAGSAVTMVTGAVLVDLTSLIVTGVILCSIGLMGLLVGPNILES